MNKKFLGLGLAAALLLVGAGCRSSEAPEAKVPEASKPYNTAPINTQTKKATTPTTASTKGRALVAPIVPLPAPAAASLSYAQTVAMYNNGARLQFINCHALPTSLSLKKGSKLMLDNRDKIKHSVTLGAKSFSIGAFGYLVMTADVAGQQTVTCDGGGVAQVNVQP